MEEREKFLKRLGNINRLKATRIAHIFCIAFILIWFAIEYILSRKFPLMLAILFVAQDLVLFFSEYILVKKENKKIQDTMNYK